jgi:hypothetical protein
MSLLVFFDNERLQKDGRMIRSMTGGCVNMAMMIRGMGVMLMVVRGMGILVLVIRRLRMVLLWKLNGATHCWILRAIPAHFHDFATGRRVAV